MADLDRRIFEMEQRLRAALSTVAAQAAAMDCEARARPIHISTMTVLFKTRLAGDGSVPALDLSVLAARYAADPAAFVLAGRVAELKATGVPSKKNRDESVNFYNQLGIAFRDDVSKKNVKVFKNGRLHITGERDLSRNLRLARDACAVLARVFGLAIEVHDFDVQMINTNLSFEAGFRLPAMRDAMAREASCRQATYEPETYPGLNAKVEVPFSGRNISVLAFNTGNVIITGIKAPEELAQAHAFLTTLVETRGPLFCRHNYKPPSEASAAATKKRPRRATQSAFAATDIEVIDLT